MHRGILVVALFASGCAKEAPEAPKDIAEIGNFLFGNFEAKDTTEVAKDLSDLRDYLLDADTVAVRPARTEGGL